MTKREGSAQRPIIIGLTGSIGMGKTTVATMFEECGVPVFDADAAVHKLQGPEGLLIPEIEAAFPGTTSADGVDRTRLGEIVFGNDQALARLESIVHPAVARMRQDFITENRNATLLVFDIPLLFEKGGATAVDYVVVVSAPSGVQRERVLARPGMTAEKFDQILKRQVTDSEKRARANYIIGTGGSLEKTRRQVSQLVETISQQREQKH
ncbi:dephospho-CoA kinase [Altererythrobacter aquiaggeris]|uniref:dephospho-CoA kinase n=1 Tax=Aestuarierythrobacter aquiaggeris TaxID=1898396 RepID=UPI0030178873